MQVIKYKDDIGYLSKDGTNKYKRVDRIGEATRFIDGDAKRFIRNNIPKSLRGRMKIMNVDGCSDLVKQGNLLATPFDTLDFDWCEKLRQEEAFKRNLGVYKNNLPLMLSDVDKEIDDIEHYIEFNMFSVSEGYDLCKLLKEKRERRRKIKDELLIVTSIDKAWASENNFSNVYSVVENMTKRYYEPKRLLRLFRGGDGNVIL